MIGFLSAFLSGAEIGFFCSLFSKRRQLQESCVVHAPPCLLQDCRVSRYKLSGTVVSTRSLRTYFIAVQRFLVARRDGRFGTYLATLLAVQGFLVARCVGLLGYFLATYTLGSLETERVNACPQESYLSREGRNVPATCAGTLVTRQISLD